MVIEFLILLILAAFGLLAMGAVLWWMVMGGARAGGVRHWAGAVAPFAVRAFQGAAVLITLGYFATYTSEKLQSAEKLSIDIRFGHFYRHFVAGEFDEAYLLMSPRYRNGTGVDTFADDYSFVPRYNPLPGRYLEIDGPRADYHPDVDHWVMSGPIYHWVEVDDEWYIDGFTWSLD